MDKYLDNNSFDSLNLNDVISLDLAANDMMLYQSGDSFTYTYPLAVPDYLFKSTNKNEEYTDLSNNIEHERLTYKLWIKNINLFRTLFYEFCMNKKMRIFEIVFVEQLFK